MLDYAKLDSFVLADTRTTTVSAGVTRIEGLTGPTQARGDQYDRGLEDGGVEPARKYQSIRRITVEGEVWFPVGTPGDTAALIDAAWAEWDDLATILVAGLTTPLAFTWRRAGGSVDLTTWVRVAEECQPDLSSDRNGPFIAYQLHLTAADPNHYGASKTANASAPTSQGGIVFPLVFPLTLGFGTGGDVVVSNAGNAKTWPQITIVGPVIAPVVANATRGESLFFDGLSLSSGDVLFVDTKPGQRQATVNGGDVRSTIRWAQSHYFPINPRGTDTLRFYGKGGGYTANTKMRVDYTDAYTS